MVSYLKNNGHARVIQVWGTSSGSGKSLIVSGLCRIFLQEGYKVCPFKAQNMALNSFVTKERREIARAQATQALACGIEPEVDMNPILIKPNSDTTAQIIIRGKPFKNMTAKEYLNYKGKLIKVIKSSLFRLSKRYQIIVSEGAGSPAEINLPAPDLANITVAEEGNASVILVGDIDRGGVFASLMGTLYLLKKRYRKRIKGIIINKFRGDISILKKGIRFIERKARIKVLGVVPYFKDIKIDEEDSLELDQLPPTHYPPPTTHGQRVIEIVVIRLPRISNFTDFAPLEREPDVILRYVSRVDEFGEPDLVIIPGTKHTIADLEFLKKSGLAKKILITSASPSTMLIGICGGYQMLGRKIYDLYSVESEKRCVDGLGILPLESYFKKNKVLNRVEGIDKFWGERIAGYEIHHGISKVLKNSFPAFEIFKCNERKVKYFEGMIIKKRIWGTYIHGIFDNDSFRRNFLNKIRIIKGLAPLKENKKFSLDKELDKLANYLRKTLDMKKIYHILRA